MNRVFKTKWSVAHQEYVVTDEKHTTKTKAAKSAVALAVAALMLGAGVASAAYMEPGFVAKNSTQLEQAKESWETAEYKKDWGLGAMHASTAYALGYHGQGVKVGVMDSGALLQKHPELSGDRFTAASAKGEYGSDGNRYPQEVGSDGQGGLPYHKGDKFDIDGNWTEGVNDSHGTHVTGTVGGNRDGNEFHGVAWGADIVVGNTGATDNNNYGPFQDYAYFKAAWTGVAEEVAKANGERGGVINNSWGTNTRVEDQKDTGFDGFNTGVHLNVNTNAETDYEFMLFAKRYGQDSFNEVADDGIVDDKSFVYAAYEAVKDKNIVQIMTTGNRDMKNPYYRALYPLYNPGAEKHWIAVAGLKQGVAEGTYELVKNFNEAGQGKWWTVAAPGNAIYSSTTDDHGNPGYAAWGGTSMAAPHVAGAMGVLMSRYDQMNALQVRDVMFTTANHKNANGSNMEGWTDTDGTVRKDGEVSDRMGWGVPDLDKGMYGPGQFLGKFDYNMAAEGSLDVWTNDITNVALDQRRAEDEKWMKDTANGTKLPYDQIVDGSGFVVKDGDANVTDEERTSHIVGEAEKKLLLEAYAERANAIKDKMANNNAGYKGSLVKRGAGTLVMTGNNTYRGGTTVEGGTLLGFAESFGVTGDDATAKANGKVTVNGGTFGLLASYNDQFTMKGEQKHDDAADHSVDVVVNAGGSFQITAGQNVTMGTLEFKEGAGFTVGSEDVDVLKEAYAGKEQTGTVTTTGVTGDDLAVANPDYAFFKTELKAEGNTLTGTLSRDETKSFATYAQNANGQAIAGALEGAAGGALYDALIGASKGDVAKTYNSLGDDFILNTRNAGIVNGMTLSRAIKDQATGIGEGRKVEMADGTARLWATGVGSWSALDYGQSDMDSDFYAGLFGAEVDVCSATKLGLFFGAGSTDNKAGDNKVESDDIHFGAYGVTNFSDVVNATYGFVYSHQSADATRALQVGSQLGMNAFSGDTDITQIFAEAAYTGLNTDAYSIEPYFGLSWIHAESDGFNEQVGTMAFSTTTEDQDVQVTTLGVRGAIPFTMGETKVALKGDVAWNHFFGDTEAEASMALAGSGVAHLKGGELGDMASVGLGVEAQVGKMTTMGLSYTGAYDGDITSHGISANVRFNF
mgnify:FL=1